MYAHLAPDFTLHNQGNLRTKCEADTSFSVHTQLLSLPQQLAVQFVQRVALVDACGKEGWPALVFCARNDYKSERQGTRKMASNKTVIQHTYVVVHELFVKLLL